MEQIAQIQGREVSDILVPTFTWVHACFPSPLHFPIQLRTCAKNLPLPDSEIYVFVNILAFPELHFSADSPGCTKQRVPLVLLDLARGTFPAYILLREAVACCTHAGMTEDLEQHPATTSRASFEDETRFFGYKAMGDGSRYLASHVTHPGKRNQRYLSADTKCLHSHPEIQARVNREGHTGILTNRHKLDVYCPPIPRPDAPILVFSHKSVLYTVFLPPAATSAPSLPLTGSSPSSPTITLSTRLPSSLVRFRTCGMRCNGSQMTFPDSNIYVLGHSARTMNILALPKLYTPALLLSRGKISSLGYIHSDMKDAGRQRVPLDSANIPTRREGHAISSRKGRGILYGDFIKKVLALRTMNVL
ncbi:hypothetical protein ARMGADRAFT_1034397 [Armillaria gallica]|uniref:Uncharacterized protein n=1 Tax=Armillaria gallica TaxID=47427 RepID=A0A2H3D205_ARMGA|nr:hypothetical protein ARMGADRAFT_1034397 [Armillaria gallica]